MPENELVPLNQADYDAAASAEVARFMPVMRMQQALERRDVIVQAFNKLMIDGQDYGKVAGGKPTLLQPGAQKLDNLFGLVPRFMIDDREEDWTGERHAGEPFFRYLIKCQLFRGDFVMGESLGECNSWESKYRYRSAERTCPDCGQATILWTKRNNWWCNKHKGGCGHGFKADDERVTKQETGRKPNPEIFDQVNTLLKMAQKRAHVGATINATSASEFFTQDLEDQREPDSAKAEQGNRDGVSVSGEVATRTVPEELTDCFRRLDANPREFTATAFRLMEDALVLAGGANGVTEYNRHIIALRKKHPKGSELPVPAIKDCLLDLYEASLTIKPPEGFAATDADVPEIIGGMK
jgi:hypothetical protein